MKCPFSLSLGLSLSLFSLSKKLELSMHRYEQEHISMRGKSYDIPKLDYDGRRNRTRKMLESEEEPCENFFFDFLIKNEESHALIPPLQEKT